MLTVQWAPKIINVPQSYLTFLGGTDYELDLDQFRLDLKGLEASVEGMPFEDTHRHNTEVTVGGVVLARVIEIINGYTVTFEDGQYAVNLVGANSNVGDVVNLNQVSIRSNNSAGLINAQSTLSAADKEDIATEVWNFIINVSKSQTAQNKLDKIATKSQDIALE